VGRYADYLDELRAEFPRFRIVKKHESGMHRAIDAILKTVTFGQMRTYLDSFQTTIGMTVYVTPSWDSLSEDERYVTMRHEAVHLRQFRRFTLPGMTLLYVFLPLPMGVAWFRAYFEKEAYEESIRAAAEVYGIAFVRDENYREYILSQFEGASYGWMWPFRAGLERWYERIVNSIET
jgi:hypothetical protein